MINSKCPPHLQSLDSISNVSKQRQTRKMAAQNGSNAVDENTDSILVTAHRGERSASTSSASLSQSDKNNTGKTERCNLLNIAKICIKTLIDTSLKKGRSLDDDFAPLNQFFIVMEHVFRHGLKGKRSLLGYRKDFWGVLETMENRVTSLKDMMSSVRSLPSIKTNVGRARAWIRVALMQKLFAEQVQAIIEGKDYIRDLYESYAMMVNEDCVVISGLLVGLNVIDCNFDLKGEDLDSNSGVIDISLYLRDGNYLEKTSMDSGEANGFATANEQKIEMVLDQKAYLEELNRSLSDSVSQLQNKVNQSQEKMKSLENELEVTKTNLREVTEKKDQFEEENKKLKNEHQKSLKLAQADINIERETYQQSRSGLNEMYLQVKRQFDTEVEHRKDLQQELTVQIAMNQEKEVAMRLLEKDVHDKQDTLVSLRKQLEDVKKINIDLHDKWQKSVDELKSRSEKWNSMEGKCNNLSLEIKELENGMKEADLAKAQALETLAQMGFKMGDIESERHTLETNLKIEREWRSGMQTDLEQEKERSKKLEKQILQVSILKEENETMKKKLLEYESKQAEQESALVEMADKLSKSQLHVDDMKEATAVLKEQVWQDEKKVGNCQQCEQAFSVARRKHHCRHCGGIYCSNCSDNTMPLPSSAKPVRVCDSCHDKLLARYKAT